MKICYNQRLKSLARELRRNSTLSEVLLWNELRARKMKGYQFMRQKPVDEYIVDFYCNKLKLVIEIDGDSHYGKIERDEIKQQKLEAMGLYVLRFDDTEVKKDIYNVLFCIEGWIDEFEKQPPCPPLLRGNKRVHFFNKRRRRI